MFRKFRQYDRTNQAFYRNIPTTQISQVLSKNAISTPIPDSSDLHPNYVMSICRLQVNQLVKLCANWWKCTRVIPTVFLRLVSCVTLLRNSKTFYTLSTGDVPRVSLKIAYHFVAIVTTMLLVPCYIPVGSRKVFIPAGEQTWQTSPCRQAPHLDQVWLRSPTNSVHPSVTFSYMHGNPQSRPQPTRKSRSTPLAV